MVAALPNVRRYGAYRIVDQLAEGGMGVVYRAEHVETGERVALKTVVLPKVSSIGGLRREIYALSRMRHPGVVRILGQGIDGGVPWYAMEMIEGTTLGAILNKYDQNLALAFGSTTRLMTAPIDPPPDSGERTAEIAQATEARSESSAAPSPAVSFPVSPANRVSGSGLRSITDWSDDCPGLSLELLRTIRRLCAPLAYLHGEGIVHRDLKPDNVVIRADGAPVLVDFGLVSRFSGPIGRESLDLAFLGVGTLGYMAPEQIRGELVDARADLYALGCMLYEIATGRPPFTGQPWEVMRHHLAAAPVPPSRLIPSVPEALEELILRLLAKDPKDRLGYADDVAATITSLLQRDTAIPPAPPPRAYLYRPALEGRAEALAELSAALDRVETRGSLVFVGGESGAGKTRLVLEVARRAVQRGVEVVTGECVPFHGVVGGGEVRGAALHPFRPLLQAMVDECRVAGEATTARIFGRRGKVLSAYEPTIAELPGMSTLPEPAALAPAAARLRLTRDFTETLAAYAAEHPFLLVLDDLQWADDLSLALLATFGDELFQSTRVAIVGTFRSEEVGEPLASLCRNPAAKLVHLGRLDRGAIAAIVADMLAETSPPADLVRFLTEESEGNPFFVSEYLRAAVGERLLFRDRLGQWQLVRPSTTSPSSPLSPSAPASHRPPPPPDPLPLPSSLHDIIARRIETLDAPARHLLEVASVLGRELDVELLAVVGGAGEVEQMDAIDQLLNRHVLEEVPPARLRFLHDKLREEAYARLPPERRRALHQAAARAIEGRDPYAVSSPTLCAELAHHWSQAEVDHVAIVYLEKAGEAALRSAAHADAASLFSAAIAIDQKHGGALATPLRRARWARLFGEASFGLGHLERCTDHTRAAIAELHPALPTSRNRWAALLTSELVRQAAHLLLPASLVVGGGESQRAEWAEVAHAAGQIASAMYFTGESLPMLATLLLSVNLAERAGRTLGVTQSYARLGYVAGLVRLHPLARTYFKRAGALARAADDTAAIAFARYLEAFYYLGLGDWGRVDEAGSEALALLVQIGDRQDAEITQTILAHAIYYAGRVRESRRRYRAILESARHRSNTQHHAWGLFLVARAEITLGNPAGAIPLLREAEPIIACDADRFSDAICAGLLATAHLRMGDVAHAGEVARGLVARLKGPLLLLAPCVHAYAGVAEVLTEVWRSQRGARRESQMKRAANAACDDLRRFARVFPIARPASLRIAGRFRHAEGRERAARDAMEKSIRAAHDLRMPCDEALAHADLAEILGAHPEAAAHRARAEVLLEEIRRED